MGKVSKRVRYGIVFVVALAIIIGIARLNPTGDPEGSNLLVNTVLAAIVTAGWIAAERIARLLGR